MAKEMTLAVVLSLVAAAAPTTRTFVFDVPAMLPGESLGRNGVSIPPPGQRLAVVRFAHRVVDSEERLLQNLYVHHLIFRLGMNTTHQSPIDWDLGLARKTVEEHSVPTGYGIPWGAGWTMDYHFVDTRGTDARCIECPCLGNIQGGSPCCIDGERCASNAPARPRPVRLVLDVDYVPATSVAAVIPSYLQTGAVVDFDVVRHCSESWPGAALKLKLDDRAASKPFSAGLKPEPTSTLNCPYWTYSSFDRGLPESYRRVRRLARHMHWGGKRMLVYVDGVLRCELLGEKATCDFLDEPLDLSSAAVVLLGEYDASGYHYGAMAQVSAFREETPTGREPRSFGPSRAWPKRNLERANACMLPRDIAIPGLRGYPAVIPDDIEAKILRSRYAPIYRSIPRARNLTGPVRALAKGLACVVHRARWLRGFKPKPKKTGRRSGH